MVITENDKDSLKCAPYTVISLIRSQTGGPTLSRLSLRLHPTCLLSPLLIICSLFRLVVCVCACMCACVRVISCTADSTVRAQTSKAKAFRVTH